MKNEESIIQFRKDGFLEFLSIKGQIKKNLEIEIADDDIEKAQGLMHRETMLENRGMLFLFDEESIQSFWMKNTIIPLDIIYVNAKLEIVKIHKKTVPFTEQAYNSEKPAKFVVEVNGGYTEKFKIFEGDKIFWSR